jgi:hypothetical protein
MNSYTHKIKVSRKLMMLLVASLMLISTIVPMTVLANSANGGGRRFNRI